MPTTSADSLFATAVTARALGGKTVTDVKQLPTLPTTYRAIICREDFNYRTALQL